MGKPPVPFFHQEMYSDLCGFYAATHFLSGRLTEKVFVSESTTFYARQLKDAGVGRDYVKQMALAGNDPEAVAYVLKGEAERKTLLSAGDLNYYSRAVLAITCMHHFIAIIKDNDKVWWKYDSLLDEPEPIQDIKEFLKIWTASVYFVAK